MRDATTKEPIPDVCLLQPTDPEAQLLPEAAIAKSSTDGVLAWDTRLVGDTFLVAESYLPHLLVEADIGAGVVFLDRGAAIQVRASSTLGNPLEGVKVVLRGSGASDYSIPAADTAIGHPYSVDPEWVMTTAADGRAVFGGLPRSKFRVRE